MGERSGHNGMLEAGNLDPDDELRLRPARFEDLGPVIETLTDAARWARTRGVVRWWPVPFPEAWVRPGILRGEVWVAERRAQIVGTFTLTQEDRRMWGEQPPVAGYVHRLAVRRVVAGRALGSRMLERAGTEVRSWGRSALRLDCLSTNEPLVRYYLRLDFRVVGRVQGNLPDEDRPSVLMERPVP